MAPGGAEFFPSCTQLRVLGNGTEIPAPNSTVSFPGRYNATDPGILYDVRGLAACLLPLWAWTDERLVCFVGIYRS